MPSDITMKTADSVEVFNQDSQVGSVGKLKGAKPTARELQSLRPLPVHEESSIIIGLEHKKYF